MSLETSKDSNLNNLAVANLQEYIQIPSVHPNVNYDDCVDFLKKQANSLQLPIKIYYLVPRKPIVIISWQGEQHHLPSILLNSHMDVVPVFEEKWTHKPFGAEIIDGKMYGRGTQDMKSTGIMYLEAVRRLKQSGARLARTIHISFVPDEEVLSIDGMAKFVDSKEFRDLNIAMSMDESRPSSTDVYNLYYAQRAQWLLHIHCPDTSKKRSDTFFSNGTAGEKVSSFLRNLYEFRRSQVEKLKQNTNLKLADVTSINLTQVLENGGKIGVDSNNGKVCELILVVDCRIPITQDHEKWQKIVENWCKDEEGTWIEYKYKETATSVTKLDASNKFWVALKQSLDSMNLRVECHIQNGGSDARFIRAQNLPSFCFSPINNTELRFHNHNEYIPIETFLKGIEIYYKIIPALASVVQ